MSVLAFSEDRCVMCGAVIPEGRMVCPKCAAGVEHGAAREKTPPERKRGMFTAKHIHPKKKPE